MWKSIFRQNYRTFLAHRFPPFATRGLARCVAVRGHLVAEAGTSKLRGGTGLHNKPLGCGASEVYASGPACEEEFIRTNIQMCHVEIRIQFLKNHPTFFLTKGKQVKKDKAIPLQA